jgi:hypothetical protein
MEEGQEKTVKAYNKMDCFDYDDYTGKPIEFIHDTFCKASNSFGSKSISVSIRDLMEWNFDAVKNTYGFHLNFSKYLSDWLREKEYYKGWVGLPKTTPMTLLKDDHVSLRHSIQCDICGTIIHVDDSTDGALMRTVCPVCNGFGKEEPFPFNYTLKKDKELWVNELIFAEMIDGDDYFCGQYSACKHKPTKLEMFYYKNKNRLHHKVRDIIGR